MLKKSLFHSPAVQIGVRALGFFVASLVLLMAIIVMIGAFTILAASEDLRLVFSPITEEMRERPDSAQLPGFDFWNPLFTTQNPIERQVVYEVSQDEIKLNLQLTLDKTEELAALLLSEWRMVDTPGFIQAAFGSFFAYGERSLDMDWGNPTWSLDSKTQRLSMSI